MIRLIRAPPRRVSLTTKIVRIRSNPVNLEFSVPGRVTVFALRRWRKVRETQRETDRLLIPLVLQHGSRLFPNDVILFASIRKSRY